MATTITVQPPITSRAAFAAAPAAAASATASGTEGVAAPWWWPAG